jgi:potassium-transporting ATPase potassium-binding subunit
MSGFSEIGDWVYIAVVLAILVGLAWPFGAFMARVFTDQPTLLTPVVRPVERAFYRLAGVDARREMRWTTYAFAVIAFNFLGFLAVYGLQRLQGTLPLNPEDMAGVEARSSFNTAMSFMTNTNWQGYAGEATMSYLTAMLALTVQNFVSAATGIAVVIALIRGLSRRSAGQIGNFWVDLTRATLYVLLPVSILVALVLVAGGAPQTLASGVDVQTIAGAVQHLPLGPAASQIAIKQLGTNGGGFWNVNSAHPFENPSAFTNLVELVAILLIPVALTFTFGRMVGNIRQGVAIFAAMFILLVAGMGVTTWAERSGNPLYEEYGVSQETTVVGEEAPGGNMEGKEVRFGIAPSTTWATFTTAASNGSVNSMHDSYTPIGGMVAMLNIATGEVIFGGVGSGLYGMLFYAIVAMFVVGLMVGRTPEYLGKRIESYEIKMAMLALLVSPFLMLSLTALALSLDAGLASRWNGGPHGFSEVLYAFISGAGNNGSAFAGLAANVPFYNVAIGLAMMFGRFLLLIPALALAGSLARKNMVPITAGTLPTTGPLWIGTLVGVVVIVGALTFFPAMALGPVIEHAFMGDGVSFPSP